MVVLLLIAGNRRPAVTRASPMVVGVHAATGAREGEPDRGASRSFGKDRWCYQREPHAGLREMPSRKLRDSAAADGDEHVPPSPQREVPVLKAGPASSRDHPGDVVHGEWRTGQLTG